MSDVDDLVAAAYSGNVSRRCWATGLGGKAAKFVEALEKRAAEGEMPVFRRVASILGELGVKIGPTSVGNHFKRECGCWR